MTRQYRVVYDGSVKNLAATKELSTDAAKGQGHIESLAAASEMEVGAFLTKKCLVYAIMA